MGFFSKSAVGIDIADNSIEFVLVSKDGNDLKVVNAGRKRLETGLFQKGVIADKDKLSAAIKDALASAKPEAINSDEVVMSLPTALVYTHHFSIEDPSDQDLKEKVRSEALTHIPIEESDLCYSYQTLPGVDGSKDVLIVATYNSILTQWESLLKGLGFKDIHFDIEPLALSRGLLKGSEKDVFATLDIGASSTNLAIFAEGELIYSNSLKEAGDQIDQEIANSLNIDLAAAKAEKEKAGLNDPGSQRAAAIVKVLEPIVREFDRASSFVQKRQGYEVKEVILLGGTSLMPSISEYFSANLNVAVRTAQPALSVSAPAPLVYLAAIGSALRIIDRKWQDQPLLKATGGESSRPKAKVVAKEQQLKKGASKGGFGSARAKMKIFIKSNPKVKILAGIVVLGGALIWLALGYRADQRAENTRERALEVASELDAMLEVDQLSDFGRNGSSTPPVDNDQPATKNLGTIIISEALNKGLFGRSGPGTDYPVLGTVYAGEEYPLVEDSSQSGWYQIKLTEDTNVWISSQYAYKKENE